MAQAENQRLMRVGIIGLGVASTVLLPEVASHPNVRITAGADPRTVARERFAAEFGAETHAAAEDLCKSPNVDAVYILTPNRLHAQHALAAIEHGKQVLADKPMALTLEDCDAIVAAAERRGVRVLVGHTQSLDPAILKMADIIHSGRLGRPLMVNTWFYSDWFYRPRDRHELDSSQGEGLVMRQGPIQVDIARMLAGGVTRSVRASTTAIDPSRPIEGSYTAFLEFENGASATLIYSGYAHFDSTELTGNIGLRGRKQSLSTHLNSRRQIEGFARRDDEYAHKEATRYGSLRANSGGLLSGEGERYHAYFGITLVNCERGDLRQTPEGIKLYTDDAQTAIAVPAGTAYERRYTSWELDAMYGAWSQDRPLTLHNAAWGRGTTEVCLGILASSLEHRDVALTRQTPFGGFGML
ncbi:MAG: Gfo/Idh/MocA family oxidoreductase [Dehalococcoidia bacterium]|nr:Gfo/Idh/MocA family oxidoreductase [Dehalococcoidia bacterium]